MDLPDISAGKIVRINMPSQFVDKRPVDVWLPDSYPSEEKYSVIYMNDGGSLFDSSKIWVNQEWKIDENVSDLLKKEKLKNTIVIGIHNNGMKRASEYLPEKALAFLPDSTKQLLDSLIPKGYLADNYLKFVVTELKPFIDSNFEVYTDSKHTFIMGSSMGGLISMYAICEYPTVFGGAACLSTHWIGIFKNNKEIPAAFLSYMSNNIPNPINHKIYFDTGDQGLDAFYPPYQREVDKLMQLAHFDSKNWITLYFEGEDHSKTAWSKRIDKPLIFLLGK
ncbi:alpha/beta hydrolase [Dysgonomonas termitidis]|uniref:Alpha/beta hydrolase n=1 Tax=Dysgonomonas termitidis TaxID=1516126 RepID=A0ABV9L2Y4_9BACT